MSRNNHTLGDGPIQPDLVHLMNGLAQGIDEILNGHGGKKRNGFVVMVFPFNDHNGRCNYISNACREDIVVLLKEQLARFEGQPEMKGHS
ncbi:hypothetical protein EHS39_13630 [Ensifer sp. MPMI2T]|nr:hypothetical protein EHS39_13630 [Ensifer sp. MPMI2T]